MSRLPPEFGKRATDRTRPVTSYIKFIFNKADGFLRKAFGLVILAVFVFAFVLGLQDWQRRRLSLGDGYQATSMEHHP